MKTLKIMAKKLSILLTLILVMTFAVPESFLPFQTSNIAEASTIKISKKTATLTVGETLKLKVNGTKTKVTWKSSDKDVVTVNKSGLVTAIADGDATVTATVSKKKYTCKITVKKAPTLVANIITTCNSLTIPENCEFSFNAKVYPSTANNKNLQWKTSDEAIVKVDEYGSCLSIKEGSAYIYAYTTDGSNVFATWKITVSNDFSKRITTDNQEIVMYLTETKTIPMNIINVIDNEMFFCNQSNVILNQQWGDWNGDRIPLYITPLEVGVTYLTFTSDHYAGEYKIKVTVLDVTQTPTASPVPTTIPTPIPPTVSPTPSVPDNSAKISSLQRRISSEQATLISYNSSLATYQTQLSRAQAKLEAVKSQKTSQVYIEGEGLVYQADPSKLRAAKEDVDYYQDLVNQYTEKITVIEDKIRSLQAEIDSLM